MAFPTTPILDNFNRSNEGPPPSANWADAYGGIFGEFEVTGNQCTVDALQNNRAENYWNTSFGPDCEIFVTVATRPADTFYVNLSLKLSQQEAIGTADAYVLTCIRNDTSGDYITINRVIDSDKVQLGDDISIVFSDGDKIGFSAVGDTLTAFMDTGSGWEEIGSRTDSTHESVSGYLELLTTSTAMVFDDFGGGTVIPTLTADGGDFTFTGGSTSLVTNRTVPATGGDFTFTGGSTTFSRGYAFIAEGGDFTFTGGDTTFQLSHSITADGGTFTLTGGDTTLTYNPTAGYTMVADGGLFSFDGGATTFLVTHSLTVDGGLFSFDGGDTDFVVHYVLGADGVTYTLAGGDTTLTYNRGILAEGGDYILTGGDADFVSGASFTAEGGDFTFTGGDATLFANKPLIANGGYFQFSGGSVSFTYNPLPCATPVGKYYSRDALRLFDNNIYKGKIFRYILNKIEYDIKYNACGIDDIIHGNVDIDRIQFNTSYVPDADSEGQIYWNSDDWTLNIDSGKGPVLQTGQEVWTLVYNNTGAQLDNGTVVSPVGQQEGRPSVDKAIANTHETIHRPVWVLTMNILHGEYGIATNAGYVRGIDTSGFEAGQEVYISTTVPGGMQSTKPVFPDYPVRVGGVTTKDAVNGEIFIALGGSIQDTLTNFWNGVFRESFDFFVTSDGTTITGALSPTNGHPDLTMIFSDGFTMLETTPDATIVLTPGTTTIPQKNFIYILQTNKVMVVSTSDWPTAEHIKVACVCLFDATTTLADGALRNQNCNDHIQGTTSNQGHLSHMTERMRQMPAAWNSGAEATVTINSTPDPDEVTIATTSGIIYQLHKQIWGAQDMAIDSHVHVVNDSVIPYKSIADLNVVTLDSTGTTLNNRYFSIVLWGIQNKSGEPSHMMINLPNGSYLSAANAIEDASNYSDYTIPKPLQGVSFLIARLTFNLSAAGSGTWTLEDNQDLRGVVPSAAGGGGAGGTGVSSWTALVDTPVSYLGQALKIPRVNAAETALEFTSNIVDHGGLTGLIDDDHAQYHNDTRGDLRYYTQTLLDAGQLDNRYYTETESDSRFANIVDNETITGSWTFTDALTLFANNSDEQIRIGYNTGVTRNAYLSIYNGQTTRRGYLQAGSSNIRLVRDGGATLDLYGTKDARINGSAIWHAGNDSPIAMLADNETVTGDWTLSSALILTDTAPAAYNSAGVNGQIALGNGYLYAHNGTRWGRVLLDFTTTW